ncbi:hypothetical protein JTB14_018916 [Gonioctena quinquepunctata]|nr:hypothetical protein JTB14_018916 [Gonioctena quinquepunctata]
METIEDFAEKVGEDYESEEYRYIIPNLKHDTQQKLLWLEYGYKMEKILNMLDTIELTLKNNKYEPLENHPNMYRGEHQILEMIYCNKTPSRWKKFEDIEKEYYRINKLDKYDEEKRGKLLRMYDQLLGNCSYTSTSTSDSIEETSGKEEQVSSSPESEGKGVADPSNNTTEAANVPKIELTDEEKEFAGKITLFAMELEPFQKLFSEMCTTLRYEYFKEWYRKISPAITDKLDKAEAKWLAGKIEIESSEEDFKSNDEIHWEDEYYAYLSNSENDEGRAEYFDKYQEAKNQLKEIRKEMEARKSSPPPTLTAKVTEPPASLYPEVVAMQSNGQTDISMEEVTIKTSPQKPQSCLYPNVVITTQLDGQAKGKDKATELSPEEGKVRDIKWKIKSLSQVARPSDPSSDFESTEEGNSPITKGKTKKAKRLRRMDEQEDTSTSEEEEGGKTPPKNRGNNRTGSSEYSPPSIFSPTPVSHITGIVHN